MERPAGYDWNDVKADINLSKHRLSFEEATHVFGDAELVILDASRPEDNESRMKAIGQIGDLLFTVVFTMRGELRWLISARRANVQEERAYGYRPPFA